MIFKLEDYEDREDTRYCMHCKTNEEAKDFCNFLHSQGREWCTGESYFNETYWICYEEATCYNFNCNSFGGLPLYNSEGYTILEWSDFMEDTAKAEKGFIDKIFEMLNVKPNEVFSLRDDTRQYRITEDLDIQILEDDGDWTYAYPTIRDFLTGLLTIVKIPKPTENDQIVIDYARLCGAKWLSVDKNGTCWMSFGKPTKKGTEWRGDIKIDGEVYLDRQLLCNLSILSWEDEEPYYIGPKMEDEEPETISSVKKILGDFKPGETVKLGEREYIVLGHGAETTAVITKDIVKDMKFGETGDYSKSYVREFCNGDFYKELAKAVGKNNIVPHRVSLTCNDGSNKGVTCKDNVSIITAENYRRYREYLSALGKPSWTATGVTTLDKDYARGVCYVGSGSVLDWSDCDCTCGVRSFCILNSSIIVGGN